MTQLLASGLYFPHPDSDYKLNTDRPYCGCLLCGEVFQSSIDLNVPPGHEPSNSLIARLAYDRRLRWRQEHQCLPHAPCRKRPGTFATPEAAQVLAALGIFSLIDLVMDDEVSSALSESQPIHERGIQH
jgi:hypothetical protein